MDFRPGFLKVKKPRKFEYNPIYWEQEKEQWEQRKSKVLAMSKAKQGVVEGGLDSGFIKAQIEGHRQKQLTYKKRLLAILLTISAVCLLLLL